jgi:predicted ATPase
MGLEMAFQRSLLGVCRDWGRGVLAALNRRLSQIFGFRKRQMNYRRINLWGGPGAGKSTMAAYLYAELKAIGFKVEFSQENFKPWAYQGRKASGYDDLLLFAQQLHAEEVYLRNGVDYVVVDCPPLMCCVYNKSRVPCHADLVNIAMGYEEAYKSINIFLEREQVYQEHGRIHSSDEAKVIDHEMRINYLVRYNLEHRSFRMTDREAVLNYVREKIALP